MRLWPNSVPSRLVPILAPQMMGHNRNRDTRLFTERLVKWSVRREDVLYIGRYVAGGWQHCRCGEKRWWEAPKDQQRAMLELERQLNPPRGVLF